MCVSLSQGFCRCIRPRESNERSFLGGNMIVKILGQLLRGYMAHVRENRVFLEHIYPSLCSRAWPLSPITWNRMREEVRWCNRTYNLQDLQRWYEFFFYIYGVCIESPVILHVPILILVKNQSIPCSCRALSLFSKYFDPIIQFSHVLLNMNCPLFII